MEAWVGLGSNQGDAVDHLREALRRLAAAPEVGITARSSLYRSAPWGDPDQEDFVNAVVAVETSLDAPGLLQVLHAIEETMGRTRSERRWGPRSIDLDLLLCDTGTRQEADLQLPHPRMHQRAFVLIPLLEIAPGTMIPGAGPAEACLQAVADQDVARLPDRW